MTTLGGAALEVIAAHVEAAYPSEGCGLVVREASGALRVQPCANLADALHAADPAAWPRTSRTSYVLDVRELAMAEARGEAVMLVYHGHCDAGDGFSEEDQAAALIQGGEGGAAPAWPGCEHLVVSVESGAARRATRYRFEARTRRFEAAEVYAMVTRSSR